MDNRDRLIKQFEPMMHERLRHFKIKQDYEDNMQKLRIITAHAIKKYNKNSESNAQLSTYIFRALTNKTKSILAQDYGTVCRSLKAGIDEKKSLYNLKNLNNLYDLLPVQQTADNIRINADFTYFVANLEEIDKQILKLKREGNKQSIIAKKLKISQAYVSIRLRTIKENLKNFLMRGDTNA